MKNRVIYMVEVFQDADTADDMLVARRFAANKKTADKIAKKYDNEEYETVVRKLHDNEREWVKPADVERM